VALNVFGFGSRKEYKNNRWHVRLIRLCENHAIFGFHVHVAVLWPIRIRNNAIMLIRTLFPEWEGKGVNVVKQRTGTQAFSYVLKDGPKKESVLLRGNVLYKDLLIMMRQGSAARIKKSCRTNLLKATTTENSKVEIQKKKY